MLLPYQLFNVINSIPACRSPAYALQASEFVTSAQISAASPPHPQVLISNSSLSSAPSYISKYLAYVTFRSWLCYNSSPMEGPNNFYAQPLSISNLLHCWLSICLSFPKRKTPLLSSLGLHSPLGCCLLLDLGYFFVYLKLRQNKEEEGFITE